MSFFYMLNTQLSWILPCPALVSFVQKYRIELKEKCKREVELIVMASLV